MEFTDSHNHIQTVVKTTARQSTAGQLPRLLATIPPEQYFSDRVLA